MKKVREHINEKFKEESDPIQDLNIGKKNQILADLKKIGLTEEDVDFRDDYTFFKKGWKSKSKEDFIDVQIKHFPKEKAQVLKDVHYTKKDIKDIIDEAVANNVDKDEILEIIKMD